MFRDATRSVAVALLGAVVLTACSSSATTSPSGPAGPAVATYQGKPGSGGFQAMLEGTVSVTNGCVTITDNTGATVTPVFPENQVEKADAPSVLVFRGTAYKEGASLKLTGGESSGRELPAGCPGTAWMVNSDL